MIGQSDTCEGRGGRCYFLFSMGSGMAAGGGGGGGAGGGRLIHKLRREEDAAACRQLGRQGGESAGKEQHDGLASYRKLLPLGEGLDAPVVEPSGSREPCVKLDVKHKMHFHPPTEKSFNLWSLFIFLYHHF